jgi:outer membrane murein-binding lipoprotein Lpp
MTGAVYTPLLPSSIASARASVSHCHHCCYYYNNNTRLDEAEAQVQELEAKVAEIEKQQALLNKLAAVSLHTISTRFCSS